MNKWNIDTQNFSDQLKNLKAEIEDGTYGKHAQELASSFFPDENTEHNPEDSEGLIPMVLPISVDGVQTGLTVDWTNYKDVKLQVDKAIQKGEFEQLNSSVQDGAVISYDIIIVPERAVNIVTKDAILPKVEAPPPGWSVAPKTEFKFHEDELLSEVLQYIESTYNSHYSGEKYQATDLIIDAGHGVGFCIGNIIKYAKRYGKKDGYNESDILKILHYALILLHTHRKEDN